MNSESGRGIILNVMEVASNKVTLPMGCIYIIDTSL